MKGRQALIIVEATRAFDMLAIIDLDTSEKSGLRDLIVPSKSKIKDFTSY